MSKSTVNTDVISGGSKADLRIIFDTFFNELCYYCNNIINNSEQAQDIVQELFIDIYEKGYKFDNEQKVKSFLFLSVKNRALNYLKSIKLKSKLDDIELKDSAEDEMLAWEVECELLEQISQIIEELPPSNREIFKLSYIDCLDVKSICERLNIKQSTVMIQRQRAKQKIREKITNNNFILNILTSL